MSNEKVYGMRFGKIYPLLVNKALRKGRTKAEVDEVICWLTGYEPEALERLAEGEITYAAFFGQAPRMNPEREKITGKVCGVQVETVPEPLMRDIRRLDKLVDELAKGWTLEKVLRREKS